MTAAAATEIVLTKDGAPPLLPFYLLVDVSWSMAGEIGALNTALKDFRDGLSKDPILSDVVRFGIVDFSDDARVVLPLTDPLESPMPVLAARGGTSYGAAFRKIKEVIDSDFAAAKAGGIRYFRPAVFFLTDGAPTDGETTWRSAFGDLSSYDKESRSGNKRYPLFVPFGFREADARVLTQLVHPVGRSKLYFAKRGASVASVLEELANAMLLSVISSGHTTQTGTPQHVLPAPGQLGPHVSAYEGGDFPDDED